MKFGFEHHKKKKPITPTGNRTRDKASRRIAPSLCVEGPHFTTKL